MATVNWTDEKIDVLDGKVDALDTKVDGLETNVDAGFARLEARIDVEAVRTDERFNAVNQQLRGLATGLRQLNDKFDAMQRTLVQVGFALVVGLLSGLVVLIGVVVTLLVTQ